MTTEESIPLNRIAIVDVATNKIVESRWQKIHEQMVSLVHDQLFSHMNVDLVHLICEYAPRNRIELSGELIAKTMSSSIWVQLHPKELGFTIHDPALQRGYFELRFIFETMPKPYWTATGISTTWEVSSTLDKVLTSSSINKSGLIAVQPPRKTSVGQTATMCHGLFYIASS